MRFLTFELGHFSLLDNAYALSIVLCALMLWSLLKFSPVPGPTEGTWTQGLEICHFNLLASTLLYVSSLNEKMSHFFCFLFPCRASYRMMPWWYVQIRCNSHLNYASISMHLLQQSEHIYALLFL